MSHNTEIKVDESKWYLCYDLQKDVFHFGFCEANSTINTWQPNHEFFATEDELASRINLLKNIDNWYADNIGTMEKIETNTGSRPPSNTT